MKQFISILLVLIPVLVFGQSSVWKVSTDSTEMYLGGTVHILRASDYPLPVEFDSAYARADKLILEADLDSLENPAVATQLVLMSYYQGDQTLQSELNPETLEALSKKCGQMGVPIGMLMKMKPSMAILTISMMQLRSLGVSEQGVDRYYMEKAKQDSLPIGVLESVQFQMNMLADLGKGNEDGMVMQSLKDFDQMETDLSAMVANWKDGTGKDMLEQIADMKKEYPGFYESLLVQRNNDWLPKLEMLLADSAVEYVLVGALHLHGPDGVLELLKAKGYRVEQLEVKD